jgi:hypothetical protein
MSSGESPSLDPPAGSPVDDGEELYRVIGPEWWLLAEDRVSSAAFSFPLFSVDIASIAGSPQATMSGWWDLMFVASSILRTRQILLTLTFTCHRVAARGKPRPGNWSSGAEYW